MKEIFPTCSVVTTLHVDTLTLNVDIIVSICSLRTRLHVVVEGSHVDMLIFH